MSDVKHTEERAETHSCDLIARHDAIDTVRHLQTYKLAEGDDMLLVDLADVQTELMMMPSAEPERHGRWIVDEAKSANHIEKIYICSSCKNFEAWGETELYNYCPNCGARMEGENDG